MTIWKRRNGMKLQQFFGEHNSMNDKTQTGCHTAHCCADHVVQISICGHSHLQGTEAYVIESLVTKQHAFLSILHKLVEGQEYIVSSTTVSIPWRGITSYYYHGNNHETVVVVHNEAHSEIEHREAVLLRN